MQESPIDRRRFLAGSGMIAGSALLPVPASFSAQDEPPSTQPPLQFAQDPALVQRMVGVSHGNLDAVRELLTEDPELAKAAWDWGFGDWETALGAASHTGSREIALLLLENGARKNLFCAAMLGEVEVVRAMIEAQPGIQRTHGPHSLTLLHHARTGGEQARAVVEYLEQVGDADRAPQRVAIDNAGNAALLGSYTLAGGESLIIETRSERGGLWLRCPDDSNRQLYRTDQTDTFHPAGAARVHIGFERDDASAATGLFIRWPGGRSIHAPRSTA